MGLFSEYDLLVPSDDPDLSDDAPEDIGFSHSKAAVLQTVKNTLEVIRQNKEKLKEKRRGKDELFKAQKVICTLTKLVK